VARAYNVAKGYGREAALPAAVRRPPGARGHAPKPKPAAEAAADRAAQRENARLTGRATADRRGEAVEPAPAPAAAPPGPATAPPAPDEDPRARAAATLARVKARAAASRAARAAAGTGASRAAADPGASGVSGVARRFAPRLEHRVADALARRFERAGWRAEARMADSGVAVLEVRDLAVRGHPLVAELRDAAAAEAFLAERGHGLLGRTGGGADRRCPTAADREAAQAAAQARRAPPTPDAFPPTARLGDGRVTLHDFIGEW
jgi:hypothetical protein